MGLLLGKAKQIMTPAAAAAEGGKGEEGSAAEAVAPLQPAEQLQVRVAWGVLCRALPRCALPCMLFAVPCWVWLNGNTLSHTPLRHILGA
jgi:hypothetical protein